MEAIGRLAAGVAHDFNNLLTVIGGYSSRALSRFKEQDPLHADLSEIRKAADRAASLTRHLLSFSRKQILQPQVLDLNGIVGEMDRMLHRLIGEDIRLLTILHPALACVKADAGQMEQVIMNLAVNARDAMPKGGTLTIETANVHLQEDIVQRHFNVPPGDYVLLAVTDSGIGMDSETQDRIFEPFFTTKPEGEGTGLGLSTVYGIVERSGGTIVVYSEVGRGSAFKVYLPRIEEAPARAKPMAAVTLPRGSETVLVAEDEDALRALVCAILREHGYKVLEARNGGEGLLLCEQYPGAIDLMVSDVVMPSMSGNELASRLSALRPAMRVLFMSGYTDASMVHHGMLVSGTAFLPKPFGPDALVLRVREALDVARG
jgi:CheY-like chemotaxis protein